MTHPILAKIEETIEAISVDSSLTALQAARHDSTLRQLRKAVSADLDKAMHPDALENVTSRLASFEDARQARNQGEIGYLPSSRFNEVPTA